MMTKRVFLCVCARQESRSNESCSHSCTDRVHLCRDEEEQRDLCRELGLTHVIEVSETGAVTLREAVGDVLVLGDGGVLTLLEGGTDADFVEKHTQIFEAWWGAAIEHLLPITPEAPKEISEDSAESDVLTVQEPAKV